MFTNPLYITKQIIHKFRSTVEFLLLQRNPEFKSQIQNLAGLKDAHIGERCFIIGNGPSLKITDLTKLRGEFTFGLNRIYLLFNSLGFPTTYYVCANRLVLSQFKDEIIQQVLVPKFTVWDHFDIAADIPQMSFVYRHNGAGFYPDITKGVWGGTTVTYVAMQIAFHMGFQDVILVGVDHSFSTPGQPHMKITSTGDDPNHFTPNYFGKGVQWQLPDLATSEFAYSLAKQYFHKAGRTILDATVGGQLQIFPKIAYEDLWE